MNLNGKQSAHPNNQIHFIYVQQRENKIEGHFRSYLNWSVITTQPQHLIRVVAPPPTLDTIDARTTSVGDLLIPNIWDRAIDLEYVK